MVHTNTNPMAREITKGDTTTTEWTCKTLGRIVDGPIGIVGIVSARSFGLVGRDMQELFREESNEVVPQSKVAVSLRETIAELQQTSTGTGKPRSITRSMAIRLSSRRSEKATFAEILKLKEVQSRKTFILIDPVSYVLNTLEKCKRVFTTNLTNRTNKNDEKFKQDR